jgi:hypothetical protein
MHFSPSNILIENIEHIKRVIEQLGVRPEAVSPRHETVIRHFTVTQAGAVIGG